MTAVKQNRKVIWPLLFLAVLSGGSLSIAHAQNIDLKIILPPQLAAGEKATLAVVSDSGALQAGVAVSLSSGAQLITDSTGRAVFTTPLDAHVLLARITEKAALPGSASAPGDQGASLRGGTEAALISVPANRHLQITSAPAWSATDAPFVILGTGFEGDAVANKVFLGGKQGAILAASPLSLVAIADAAADPGPGTLFVQTRDGASSTPITFVRLEMMESSSPPFPGGNGLISLRVLGTEESRGVEVRNLSPQVIRLARGNSQNVASSGGTENIVSIPARGLRDGNFSLDVQLEPAITPPDPDAASKLLEAAFARASGDLQHRIAGWVAGVNNPREIPNTSREIQKTLSKTADADLAALLRAAQLALRGYAGV